MTEYEKKDIEAADKEETEAHDDKVKDEEKNTEDRQKFIDADSLKADFDEFKAHNQKKHEEFENRFKELEKKIIQANRQKAKEDDAEDNDNRDGAIGY